MLRRVLLILSVVGLASSAGLWAASYCFTPGFAIAYQGSMRGVVFAANQGAFRVTCLCLKDNPTPPTGVPRWQSGAMNGEIAMWFGPETNAIASRFGGGWWTLTCPFYVLSVPLLFFSAFSLPLLRRRRRRRLGLCVACAYDLRGSLGVCPECGEERA
jgi:hypothetical protein